MVDISIFHYILIHHRVDKKIALAMISYLTPAQRAVLFNQPFACKDASWITDRRVAEMNVILGALQPEDRISFLNTRDAQGNL